MKRIFFSTIIGLAAVLPARAQTPCSRIVTLSGNITANRTLHSDTIYRISGCVAVTSAHTLTIQAGTVIEMQDNSILEILQGAQIMASGTAASPIVFTSGVDVPGSRAQVTNASIIIAGNARANFSSTTLPCGETFTTGNTPADNSGTLQYVQVHYLDGATTSGFENALSLVGVGSGTTIDHVEVTNSGRNGVGILGGTPTISNLVTMDNYENGIWAVYGTQAVLDGYLENRQNTAAHYSAGSNGIMIQNDPGNASATPITHMTINNASILGPGLCHSPGGLSADFKDGIYIGNNAEAEVYNSVIAGQVRNGLYLDNVTGKTSANQIQCSYNSFYGNGQNFDAAPSSIAPGWASAGGCGTSMQSWLEGTAPVGCTETGNQLGAFTLGYDASFCGNYCDGAFVPDFVLTGATELDDPSGTSLFDNRGAVQLTDRFDWLNVCPQDKVYCSSARPSLNFAPNPAKGSAYALFRSGKTGTVTIAVLNGVTGVVLSRTTSRITSAGRQKMAFSVAGLREGVYTVRVQAPEGVLYGKIVVK